MANYELTLAHHGVDGQQWGVRNGPPYPLSRQGSKAYAKILSRRQKAQGLLDNADDLSYEDLKKLMDRIDLEERIRSMTVEQKQQGSGIVKKILSKVGNTVVDQAVPALTVFALKQLANKAEPSGELAGMIGAKKK